MDSERYTQLAGVDDLFLIVHGTHDQAGHAPPGEVRRVSLLQPRSPFLCGISFTMSHTPWRGCRDREWHTRNQNRTGRKLAVKDSITLFSETMSGMISPGSSN